MRACLWLPVCVFVCAVGANATADEPTRTRILDADAAGRLLGQHLFSLQWISWTEFGMADVVNENGLFHIKGLQEQKKSENYIRIQGVIPEVGKRHFLFDGTIVMRVSHINEGRPCERKGRMKFRITGKRKYWRLMQMDNPCDGVTDYVDVFFQRPGVPADPGRK